MRVQGMWGWVFAVVAVVAVLVLLAWGTARIGSSAVDEQRKWEEERQARPIAPADLRSTIRVLMSCPPGAEDRCAAALHSVFDRAEIPWRVSATVVHHVGIDPDCGGIGPDNLIDDVLALYALRCHRDGATSFAKRIDVQLHPAAEFFSTTAALGRAEPDAAPARFTLVLGVRTELERGWDRLLLGMLRRCRRKHGPGAMVTGPPTPRDGITGLLVSDGPMFAPIVLNDAGFPVPAPVPFARSPTRCFPTALWCPALAFGPTAEIDGGFCADAPPTAEIYAQSARYHARGWRFFLPDTRVATEVVWDTEEGPRGFVRHDAAAARRLRDARLRNEVPEGAEALREATGVGHGVLSRNARLGVLEGDVPIEEALAKFGTSVLPTAAPSSPDNTQAS